MGIPTGSGTPLFSWIKAELKTKPDRVPRALLLLEGAIILEEMGRVGEAAKAMVAAANSDPSLLPAIWFLIFIFFKPLFNYIFTCMSKWSITNIVN